MSDMQEFSALRSEENSSLEHRADFPGQEESKSQGQAHRLKEIEETLDTHSYFLGEVPQSYLVDPKAFLPLNSDKLAGAVNMVETLLSELNILLQEQVTEIQKLQRKITFWEDRIEKNKSLVASNQNKIKQNLVDISYDKKNRDYWSSRSEQVMLDFQHAQAAGRKNEWAWLIKKYALKNPDGTQMSPDHAAVDELCNGGISNLAGEYQIAGNKYEEDKKDKETENIRLIRENGRYENEIETLQGFISATYTNEIEPIQDGVLLLKEFGVKLKSMSQDANASYGELRSWAEVFLNDFIKANSRVRQSLVTEFRRLASIPLPASYC